MIMKQDLPSYIANDAAPLFPDLSAMSDEEFGNYESPPERLAFYRLHTEEGLKAFLYDVYWIGYPGLFIAANPLPTGNADPFPPGRSTRKHPSCAVPSDPVGASMSKRKLA